MLLSNFFGTASVGIFDKTWFEIADDPVTIGATQT